ncbi:MAG: AAA family ATPase [Thermodesulfobacteriota bacterium]
MLNELGTIHAFSGAHGTGKTTAVFSLAARLKRDLPLARVGIVQEVAGKSPFPINRDTSEKGQLWIFSSQIAAELSAAADFHRVVSDRCAVDAIAYTQVAGFDRLAEGMIALYREHLPLYREIRVLSPRAGLLVPDGMRDVDSAFQQEVHARIVALHRRLGGPVTFDCGAL